MRIPVLYAVCLAVVASALAASAQQKPTFTTSVNVVDVDAEIYDNSPPKRYLLRIDARDRAATQQPAPAQTVMTVR